MELVVGVLCVLRFGGRKKESKKIREIKESFGHAHWLATLFYYHYYYCCCWSPGHGKKSWKSWKLSHWSARS
jgi:hypothetical protein